MLFDSLAKIGKLLSRSREIPRALRKAARRTRIDQSNLNKYERNAKGITAATLDRTLDGYGATLADLAATLREMQGGPAPNCF